MSLLYCRTCSGAWQDWDPDGFAVHEATCALAITCPKCGALPTVRCSRPSGPVTVGAHAERESLARMYPVAPEDDAS